MGNQCQGAIYFPSRTCPLSVMSTRGALIRWSAVASVGEAGFSAVKKATHATRQMFTVAEPNTLHLFLFLSSVHVQQQQQEGFVEWMI